MGRAGGAGERKPRGERPAGSGKPAERRRDGREDGGQGKGRRADAAAREAGREGGSERQREPRQETVDTNEVIASVLRFVLSPVEVTGSVLELSPELTGLQRKMVHELIDKAGAAHVTHESEGMFRERRLVLRKGAVTQPTPTVSTQPAVDQKVAAPASVKSEGEEGGDESEEDEESEESEGEKEKTVPEGGPKKVLAFGKGGSKKKKSKQKKGGSGGGEVGGPVQAPIDDAWLDVNSTGGHVLGQDGQGRKAARANTSLLASLHAERQARLGGGSNVASAQGARPAPPRPPSGETKAKGGGGAAEEIDEMELLEQAINGNMKMTELIRNPSEGMKARYYGWDTNQAQRKDLHKKLSEKIKDSVNDRKPTTKDDKKGGGGRKK